MQMWNIKDPFKGDDSMENAYTTPPRKGVKSGIGIGSRIKLNLFRYWQLYLFLLLPLSYILVFQYYPMAGLQIAFKKFSPREGIWGGTWVGLNNFRKFFGTYKFTEILRNTLTISAYSILANIPVPIILALALNSVRSKRFSRTVQMLSYMPHFISTVVIVSMLTQILNPRIGIFAALGRSFGFAIPDLFASPNAFSHLYVWSGIWQNAGWASIIYIAALAGVDPELHEAATVDGASRLQRVRYIDVPVIIPTAVIMIILNMGNVMNLGFEKVFLMQNALNVSASEIIATYTYKIGLTGYTDYSYATAIGFFNSVVNLILIVVTDKVAKKLSGSGLF